MSSVLNALNTANLALQADQIVIATIDHNVANAQSEGYSQQTAHLVTTPPYTVPSMMRPTGPGQIGSGVQVQSITRSRDALLDAQFRYQNQYAGQWTTLDNMYTQLQGVLTEPSTTGLNSKLSNFFNSWHALSDDPTNTGARASVQQSGIALASTLNSDAQQLAQSKSVADAQVGAAVTTINNNLTQIANLNGQIRAVLASGQQPNDLMDQRDVLIDQLSNTIPITYSQQTNGTVTINLATQVPGSTQLQVARPGAAPLVSGVNTNLLAFSSGYVPTYASTAAGTESMSLTGVYSGTVGTSYIVQATAVTAGAVTAVQYSTDGGNTFTTVAGPGPFSLGNGVTAAFTAGAVVGDSFGFNATGTASASFTVTGAPLVDPLALTPSGATTSPLGGQLGAAVKLRDVIIGGPTGLQSQLDAITQAIVQAVNVQHAAGFDLNGNTNTPFFTASAPYNVVTGVTAANISVAAAVVSNPQAIAAASSLGAVGDGSNAQAISNLVSAIGGAATPLPGFTILQGYQNTITALGANAQQAKGADQNQGTVMQSMNAQRQSLSGVNVDEQMTFLIQFQHSFSAAARVITTVDSMLDTIINRMGLGN